MAVYLMNRKAQCDISINWNGFRFPDGILFQLGILFPTWNSLESSMIRQEDYVYGDDRKEA
jgi:hypothetical protein